MSSAQEWTVEWSGQEAGETREVFTALKAADELAALHKHEGTSASLFKTDICGKSSGKEGTGKHEALVVVCRPFF